MSFRALKKTIPALATSDGAGVSILSAGDSLRVAAGTKGARLLPIAGAPIGEPIAQYGPFVMNTQEEIQQTLQDYREGRLTD